MLGRREGAVLKNPCSRGRDVGEEGGCCVKESQREGGCCVEESQPSRARCWGGGRVLC